MARFGSSTSGPERPASRLAPRLVLGLLLFLAACLSDQVVAPAGPLPGVIAADKPTIQFVRFALGRRVEADTVHLSNNGEADLGTFSLPNGIQYVTTTRTGWLAATIVPGSNEARLVLTPTYPDTAGGPPDTAQVTIHATGANADRTITVVARTIPGARFEFSANPVTFASVPGGPATAVQTFSVRNGGNGTLPIYLPRLRYVGTTADWLTADRAPSPDSLAPSFDLTAKVGSLLPGLYTAYVVFESPLGDPTRAPADSFVVQTRIGAPNLGVSAGQVSFSAIRGGAAPAPQAVTLANVGEGTFESLGTFSLGNPVYSAGKPTGWLSATLTGNTVLLTATAGSLPADTLTAKLPITSQNGGTITLTVTLEVRLPGLTLSSQAVSFNAVEGGTNPSPRTVTISNSGSGTLATLGTLAVGGVTFGPAQPAGWLQATLRDSTVMLTPTLGRLVAGTYPATVQITSQNGGDQNLAVTFSVARATDPPVLTLSTATIALSGTRGDPNPPTQVVAITNTGGGTLGTVTIGSILSPGGTWLNASANGDNVLVDVATGSLAPGNYSGTVKVNSQRGGSATIAVAFSVGVPTLTLSAVTTSFGATAGGPATPASRTVTITNTGSGSISSLGQLSLGTTGYGPGQPSGWLSATRTGTTITLSATTGSLGAGLYTATVPVSSVNGGNSAIAVTFSVVPPVTQPVLALSATALSLSATQGGANPAGQSVTFYNSGGGVDGDLGAVTAPIPGTAPWLNRTIGANSITFTATTGSLAAGLYTATVPVSSTNGGSVNVVVSLTVSGSGTPPALALSSNSASFAATEGGGNPSDQSLTVLNVGGGSLGTVNVGTVSYGGTSAGWLTATYSSVSGTIALHAATASLPPGTSTATFTVTTTPTITGSPATVTVGLTVAEATVAPHLTVSSTAASFAGTAGGAAPAAQTITISNSGGGGLSALGTLSRGTVTYTPSGTAWLTTATINGGTGVLMLRPALTGLSAGVYQASFPVTGAAGPSGSPTTITVNLTVNPAGGAGGSDTMTVSPHLVAFAATAGGSAPAAQTVTIANPGAGGLAGLGTLSLDSVTYARGATGWLTTATLNPTAGTVSLRPSTGSLAAGTYRALVWLAGTAAGIGSPETVEVVFTVAAGATASQLSLSSQTASFAATEGGTAPGNQTISVLNTGGGSLGAITVGTVSYGGASSGWLAATYSATAGDITLAPTTTGLPAGQSTATFDVSAAGAASGSPRTVTVRLSVAPAAAAPELTLSSQSVSFAATEGGGSPSNQSITITNTGGGSLGTLSLGAVAYTGGATGWLSRSLSGGTLGLTATTGSLAAGTYQATFSLSAATGTAGSPATITVRFSVAPNVAPPVLTLSTQAVSFSTQAGGTAAAQTVSAINTGGGTFTSLGAINLGTPAYTGASSGWLAASINAADGTITLTPSTAGLPSGSSTASLQVNSAHGGNSTVTATLTVAASNAPPVLSVSLSNLAFNAIAGGPSPPPQVVVVGNSGGGTLGNVSIGTITFAAGQPNGWLLAPASGAPAQGAVTFSVTSGALPAGVYTAAVPITSASAGTQTVAVALNVTAPILTLASRAASFNATQGTSDPAPLTISFSNTGVGNQASLGMISLGSVRYRPGQPTGWLSAQLSGSSVSLAAHLGNLPSGTFVATVPVLSSFGGSDTVTTIFTVAPGAAPPVLAVSSNVINFTATVGGDNPPEQSIQFTNAGGQTLGTIHLGTPHPAAPWLTAAISGNTVTFDADVTGLAAGAYATTVPLETANAGSQNIGVAFTVGSPRIALSARSVTFGDTVGSARTLQTDVFISNGGAGNTSSLGSLTIGTIGYAAGQPTGWIQAPAGAAVLTTPIVSLSASVGSLPASTYTGFIPVISSRGGTDTITVQMAVNRPDPAFDKPSIAFLLDGAETDSAVATRAAGDTAQFAVRIKVGNPNNTAIGLSGLRVGGTTYLSGSSGWITGAFLDKTSAPFGSPAELLIAINPKGLPKGRHRAQIEISSDVAKNSPKKLTVILVIS